MLQVYRCRQFFHVALTSASKAVLPPLYPLRIMPLRSGHTEMPEPH
jgi:hypothetical protein